MISNMHCDQILLFLLVTSFFHLETCQNIIDGILMNVLNPNQTATTSSNLTQQKVFGDIPVYISVEPYKQHSSDGYLISSGTNINFSAVIEDPKLDNLTYKWSTKSGPINANLKKIQFTFKNPNEADFIKVDVSKQNTTNQTEHGSSQETLMIKEPLVILDPVGKLFLEHGELLTVTLKYKGSPPFTYCYKFCQDTDILPCDFCFPSYETESNQILINHYLHNVGNYTLMFSIKNVMNEELKHYAIKINDTVRVRTVPFIPIISSILAVFILLIGVAVHLHYRKTGYTETADFDFVRTAQEEEEWEEEQSFIQRVRYLFLRDGNDYSEHRYLIGPIPDSRR